MCYYSTKLNNVKSIKMKVIKTFHFDRFILKRKESV